MTSGAKSPSTTKPTPPSTSTPTPTEVSAAITVYWRPGCLFCSDLLHGLKRQDVRFEMRNIWDDADAAAFVRSVARGNETVPTVTVGSVAMVNPSVEQVLDAVERA